jgi:hypothetical protein
LLNINAWQKENDDAREADQEVLNERLHQLEMNQQRLMETLSRLLKQPLNILAKTILHRYASNQHYGNDDITPTTT